MAMNTKTNEIYAQGITRSELEPQNNQKSFYGKAILYHNSNSKTVTLYSYNTDVARFHYNDNSFTFTTNVYHLTATTLKHIRSFVALLFVGRTISKQEIIKSNGWPWKVLTKDGE